MNLFELTKLAKKSPEKSGEIIKEFIFDKFKLAVERVKINDCAVSLNSVNGYIFTKSREKLFFKFHAEEGEEETVDEYYRSGILEKAGYPVISPLYESKIPGEQFLIYEFIEYPTFFDVGDKLDLQFWETEKYDEKLKNQVLKVEENYCDLSVKIAKKTLKMASSEIVENEAIWQLFFKRLVSDDVKNNPARIDLFYTGKNINLPNDEVINFDELKNLKWIINGNEYDQNLAEIIDSAKDLLNPKSRENWAVITAHGDDHNGNKFFIEEGVDNMGKDGHEHRAPTGDVELVENLGFKFFDPAFAGENIPALLVFVKTVYHDVLAHPFYLYNPERVKNKVLTKFEICENKIILNHNFDLEKVAPLRKELLEIKMKKLWKPLILELKSKNILGENSREFVKKALFCCPFLCLNLIDKNKFSPEISVFALANAVMLGTNSEGNFIDRYLDEVFG